MKRLKHYVGVILATIALMSLVACGSKESKLLGTWYDVYKNEFTFYEDGTYTKYDEYGTGKWSILKDGKLKMVDFYGTTHTAEYEIDGKTLTITDERGKQDYNKE